MEVLALALAIRFALCGLIDLVVSPDNMSPFRDGQWATIDATREEPRAAICPYGEPMVEISASLLDDDWGEPREIIEEPGRREIVRIRCCGVGLARVNAAAQMSLTTTFCEG